jgi:trigger factor
LNVTAERIPDSQVLLTIEIDPERVEQSMDQAYRRVLPRVRVPGFRPGKAPRPVLERHVGREALLHEALDKLVPEVVDEAIKAQQLRMVDQPSLEITSLDPVVVKATVPVLPDIDLGDYRALRLEPEPVQVDEADVERALDDLRHRYATIEPVERPAAEGDRVRVAITAEVEGRRLVHDDDVELTVRPEALTSLPGLYEHLLGMTKDEAVAFDAVIPADYRRAELAGKTIHYRVTVLDVKAEVLPDLDDDFARQVGEGFADLAALRARVTADLRARAEEEAKRRLQEQAVEALIGGATLEIPPQMIEREIEHMIRDMSQPAGDDRRAMERFLQQVGRSEAALREELRPAATERVKRTLVLSKLAELEGIAVDAADVERELESIAGTTPRAAQVRRLFDTPTGREVLERNLRSRRTLDRLTEIVTGRAPPPGTPPAPASEQAPAGALPAVVAAGETADAGPAAVPDSDTDTDAEARSTAG